MASLSRNNKQRSEENEKDYCTTAYPCNGSINGCMLGKHN